MSMKQRMWTTKEIQFLKENRNEMTVKQLANVLNRTQKSVKHMLAKRGIYKKEVLFKVIKADEILAIGTAEECAKILNVSDKTIYNYASPKERNRAVKKGFKYAVRL